MSTRFDRSLRLPPLSVEAAAELVNILELMIDLLWDAHGDRLVDHFIERDRRDQAAAELDDLADDAPDVDADPDDDIPF